MNIPKIDSRKKILMLILAGATVVALLVIFAVFSSRDRAVLFSSAKTFDHNGRERTYIISHPQHVTEDTKVIIGLHGFGDSGRRFGYYTGLHNAAKDDIVVYPNATDAIQEGTKTGWNVGFCCGSGWINEIDDAGFIAELALSVANESGVGNDRIFATGFSNGGFMAQRLAADYPEVFKAVAVASGSAGANGGQLEPNQPVPILFMHGEQDTIVPFEGGVGRSDPDFTWLSFEETTSLWQQNNEGTAVVEVKTYKEDGHKWHDWRILNFWHRQPQGSKTVSEFFSKSL